MKITKENKKELSKNFSKDISETDIIFASYSGLKFEEITELRAKLKEIGSNFSVKRNTIILHGLKSASLTVDEKSIKGPTAVVLVSNPEEISNVAKVMVDFSKTKPALKLKGGFISKNWTNTENLIQISKIGSKKDNISKFANVLYTSIANIRYVLDALIEEKKSKENK